MTSITTAFWPPQASGSVSTPMTASIRKPCCTTQTMQCIGQNAPEGTPTGFRRQHHHRRCRRRHPHRHSRRYSSGARLRRQRSAICCHRRSRRTTSHPHRRPLVMANLSCGPYTLSCLRYSEAVSDSPPGAASRRHRHRGRRPRRRTLCPGSHASSVALRSSNEVGGKK